uniref:tetratricopeptide repeat protein n=1 Tax=Umezakia ovalisporum TaxID=75695 RepID=UPI0039C6FB9C
YTLQQIGIAYFDLGRREEEVRSYFEALKYAELAADSFGIARSYIQLSDVNIRQGKSNAALQYLLKGLSILENNFNH